MTPKDVLVIHCSLAVSRRNVSPSHEINTSQAETVGLPPCNDFPTSKFHAQVRYVTHQLILICPSTPPSSPAAMGEWRKQQVEVTTGGCSHRPTRRRSMGKWSFYS